MRRDAFCGGHAVCSLSVVSGYWFIHPAVGGRLSAFGQSAGWVSLTKTYKVADNGSWPNAERR